MIQSNEPGQHGFSDDELLAKAIPIDPADLRDDGDQQQPMAMPDEPAVRDVPKAPSPTHAPSRQSAGGARRVKTFVVKLKQDLNDPIHGAPHCVEELDKQINAWLKAHPGATVKFATPTCGELMSKKGADSALIVSVWI